MAYGSGARSKHDVWMKAVRDAIPVPDYIAACASAIHEDLMIGPSVSVIRYGNIENLTEDDTYSDMDPPDDIDNYCPECGDVLTETYTGIVGATLRAFIEDLPCHACVVYSSGEYMEREPSAWFDLDADNPNYNPDDKESEESEFGVGVEPWRDDIISLDPSDIVYALFGRTIAREFS